MLRCGFGVFIVRFRVGNLSQIVFLNVGQKVKLWSNLATSPPMIVLCMACETSNGNYYATRSMKVHDDAICWVPLVSLEDF